VVKGRNDFLKIQTSCYPGQGQSGPHISQEIWK